MTTLLCLIFLMQTTSKQTNNLWKVDKRKKTSYSLRPIKEERRRSASGASHRSASHKTRLSATSQPQFELRAGTVESPPCWWLGCARQSLAGTPRTATGHADALQEGPSHSEASGRP